jgi:AAA family ATP:ADP antiporter
MAKPAATGTFLAHFSADQLPWMYLLTAVTAGIVSFLYSRAMGRYTFLRVNLWTLAICLLSLLAFAIIEPQSVGRGVVAVGLYTWVGVFGVLAASQFWMMANLVFDVRQAKRLFGLIGAGAITGGITGGYLASLLAETYGMNGLLYGATCLLFPCLPISWYLWRHFVPIQEKRLPLRTHKEEEASPARLILESRHLQLLSGIIALSVITAKLVEFQFSSFAAMHLEGAEELTSFFGFWFSTFNVIGLTLQLFFTHRLFQRFGVGNTLSILPAGLTLGAVLMFFFPGLNMATLSRLVDGGLKQSLQRVGIEMLFVPVSAEVKRRVKTYLDVMVDTVAGGLGGLLLLLLIDGFQLPLTKISVLIFFFSMAWLSCVLLMRSEYLNAFRRELRRFLPDKKPEKPVTSHRKLLAGLLNILDWPRRDTREDQLLFALSRKEIIDLKEFKRPLLRLLTHPSSAINAGALRCLSNWQLMKIHLRMDRFLNDPDPRIRTAALEFLISHDLDGYEAQIRKQLNTDDPETSGSLFLKLLSETRENANLRARWGLEIYFEQRVSSLEDLPIHLKSAWQEVLLQASVMLRSPLGDDFIFTALSHKDPIVVASAIRTAGTTRDVFWVLPLIGFLSEVRYRQQAKKELLGYGEGLISILKDLLEEKLPDVNDARHFPALLKVMNSPKSVLLLFELVEKYYSNDLILRKEAFRALNTLKRNFPKLVMPAKRINGLLSREISSINIAEEVIDLQTRLSLVPEREEIKSARKGLITLLARRQHGNVSRLFRLLGLQHPVVDIIPIYRALSDKKGEHRASALELLDNLLQLSLRRRIIPLLDRVFKGEGQDKESPLSARDHKDLETAQLESFEQLLVGDDLRLKLAVIYLISLLQDPRYIPILKTQLENTDLRVADQARRIIARLKRGVRES